jgi:hypothetical protein
MILHVKKAKYLHDYVLWVRFSDGVAGEVDLAGELDGEVFEPLKDIALFKAFRVDSELETIVWPNEADLAPEFLREKLRPAGEYVSGRSGVVQRKPLGFVGAVPTHAVREKRPTYRVRRPKNRK